MDLTQRQNTILKTLVEQFTQSAEPVGSKTLIPLLDFSVSSATIRNELAVLEKAGLLEKTHTSSGRIPSPKGYRYYVEKLMDSTLDSTLEEQLRLVFSKRHATLEEMVELCSSILAQMTHLTSVVIGPEQNSQTLVRLSMIPVNEKQAVALVVTSSGHTEHRVFRFSQDVSTEDLETCAKLFNEQLQGVLISEMMERLEKIRPMLAAKVARSEVLFEAFVSAFMGFAIKNQSVSGRANMLAQPDFADRDRLEKLMRVLENESLFHQWTEAADNICTPIDGRSELIQIGDCSVLSAKFDTGQGENGQLMVIGPNRMPYGKVVALMDFMSRQIEQLFGNAQEGGQDEQKSLELKETDG